MRALGDSRFYLLSIFRAKIFATNDQMNIN